MPPESAIEGLIARLPKVELHVHIEGTFEPELMFEMAARNGVRLPYARVEDLARAYDFGSLQDFLDLYYQGMSALRTAEDFHDLAFAYLTRAAADNVMRAEIFFDPQGHTERGVAFDAVMEGLTSALERARAELGIETALIMCFLRHLSEASAAAALDEALRWRERIVGVGLDSSELGHPPSKFERVFARARREGFRLVAHAGEEGPADYVREALDLLGVERIDHGVRALEDAELTRRLAETRTPLTVCPLSNLKLRVVERLQDHPLRVMLEKGLCATVNSDDPAYFGGYMNANFSETAAALDLNAEHIATLGRNAIEASFADAGEKAAMTARLEAAL